MQAFPEVLRTSVSFASEGEHGTRVTVVSETLDGASAEETDAFRSERTGMTRGWTGSFDKLEALLASE